MSRKSNPRRNSILIATLIAIGLIGWMASGFLGRESEPPATTEAAPERPMSVSVRHSVAQHTTRTIVASARTEPERTLELKAETVGRVVEITAERGATVTAGQKIVALDIRDRRSQLAEADALIRQRELEFEAAERLRGEQFLSPSDLAAREAQLVSARAARDRIALDIDRTEIKAPFDAIVYDRSVEIGDYLAIGDPVAELVDIDPIIVVGNINERNIGALDVGSTGLARVLDGTEVEGRVRYIAPLADESTRSFRLELEIPNPDLKLRAGTSAELVLGAEEIVAHALNSSQLTLADDGTIGVKIVDGSDRVRFMPVEIAESKNNQTWVTGLPPEVRIITEGQGFVTDGQLVVTQEDPTSLTRAQNERTY
jgi:multidrug efflux system membrane fusion protein